MVATDAPTIDDIKERNVSTLTVLVPPDMKSAVKEYVEKRDMSVMDFIRKLVADEIGFTLPEKTARQARRKYATAEEREAAQKAKAKERRDLVKDLLAKYKAEQGGSNGAS